MAIGKTKTSGALSVKSTHVFANTTERDAFFTGTPESGCEIIVGTNYQVWSGSTWLDRLVIAKGDKGDKGDTGPKGDTGAIYEIKGTYNQATAYIVHDLVFYQGSSYVCTSPTTGNFPTVTSYWQIVAEKGDTGISGLTWRGTYAAGITYAINDVVEYDNAGTKTIYVSIEAGAGNVPTNTTYWNELPIRGARGDTGPKGDKGDKGDTGAQGPSGNGDVGDVKMIAGGTAPTGWLMCNGQAVSRTTYSALYSNVGTKYGVGDGTTTFNVPRISGRMPIGLDDSQGEFATLGQVGGEKNHTLDITEIPTHSHSYVDKGDAGSTGEFGDWGTKGTVARYNSGGTYNTGNRGGGQAHNNLPPYIVLNFCIKY